MTLKEYKELNRLTYGDLAKLLKVTPQSVKNWINRSPPNRRNMLKIETITQGSVSPVDWYK